MADPEEENLLRPKTLLEHCKDAQEFMNEFDLNDGFDNGLDAQTSKHQMKAIDNQYHTSATFHTSTSAKNLQHTSLTSQGDCGNPYADSTAALFQSSGFGSLSKVKQILRHSVPIDEHMRSEPDTRNPKCV